MDYELLDNQRVIAHQDREIRTLYEILDITSQVIQKYGLNTTKEVEENLLKIIENRFDLKNYEKYFIEILGDEK